MRLGRSVVVILSFLLSSSWVVAGEPQCGSSPTNAMYRIVASGCPGVSPMRLSTGFRVGSSIYAALHGVLGCTGDIVGYPECPVQGYDAIPLVHAKVAKSWDLVQLTTRSGALLQGASLTVQTSRPKNGDALQVCGYPTWNHRMATCSGPFTFQPGQSNVLYDLLSDGGDSDTESSLKVFGLPSLRDIVVWHEALGGGGVSGGPMVVYKGNQVVAVHDGRFNSQQHERFWAIPLFDKGVVWLDWKTLDAELRDAGKRNTPSALHFGSYETVATSSPIDQDDARQFLELFIGSILSSYACDWMRTGTEIVNEVCPTGDAPCRASTGRQGYQFCDAECIGKVYQKPIGQLTPTIQLLCDQFANAAGTSPDSLGCSRPQDYAWFSDHQTWPFASILFNGTGQFEFMRELYFAALPDRRRADLIQSRLTSWANDARARGGYWTLDKAEAIFHHWQEDHKAAYRIDDSYGVPFYLDPAMSWSDFQAQLFIFVIKTLADGVTQVNPVCFNASMDLDQSDTWRYTTRPATCEKGKCLRFPWSGGSTVPNAAGRLARALVASADWPGDVHLLRGRPPAQSSVKNEPMRIHASAHLVAPASANQLSVDIVRESCKRLPLSLPPFLSCQGHGIAPGDSFGCEVDTRLSTECGSATVRWLMDDVLVRRQLVVLPDR
jgi:hypothetical protein